MFSTRIASYLKHSALALAGVALLAPALSTAGSPGYDRGRYERDHHDGRNDARPGYVYDTRYGHNHYYPPRGYAVGALPRGYVTLGFRGGPYYYNSGIWYRRGGAGFVVVRPAIGLF